jgi:hypothetical protein
MTARNAKHLVKGVHGHADIARPPDACAIQSLSIFVTASEVLVRFAEQVLNSKLALKEEIEAVILKTVPDLTKLSRPAFNQLLRERFVARGWESQPAVFHEPEDPGAKMDFLKERIGIEVGFGHASFIGIDLLKFQVASYSALDNIDAGVYVVTTRSSKDL